VAESRTSNIASGITRGITCNLGQIVRPFGLRNRLMKIIFARASSTKKWQPEYQTRSHQINDLAMAL
jgi:hypothetical protein